MAAAPELSTTFAHDIRAAFALTRNPVELSGVQAFRLRAELRRTRRSLDEALRAKSGRRRSGLSERGDSQSCCLRQTQAEKALHDGQSQSRSVSGNARTNSGGARAIPNRDLAFGSTCGAGTA
jgi:hypothetical protein